jgi:hypothetical protein
MPAAGSLPDLGAARGRLELRGGENCGQQGLLFALGWGLSAAPHLRLVSRVEGVILSSHFADGRSKQHASLMGLKQSAVGRCAGTDAHLMPQYAPLTPLWRAVLLPAPRFNRRGH